MRCEISPLAEFDLEEIGDYIARDNPSRAVSFVREIRACCDKIAYNPEAAPLRHDLGEGIRMAIFGRYITCELFSRKGKNEISVQRFFRG